MKQITLLLCVLILVVVGGFVGHVWLGGLFPLQPTPLASVERPAAEIPVPATISDRDHLTKSAVAAPAVTGIHTALPVRTRRAPALSLLASETPDQTPQVNHQPAASLPPIRTVAYDEPTGPDAVPMTPRLLGLYRVPSDPPSAEDRLPTAPRATNNESGWLLAYYPLPDAEHFDTRDGDRLIVIRDGERLRDQPVAMKDRRQWIDVARITRALDDEAERRDGRHTWQVRVVRSRTETEPTRLVESERSNPVTVIRDTTPLLLLSADYITSPDGGGEVSLNLDADDLDPKSLSVEQFRLEWLDPRGEPLADVTLRSATTNGDVITFAIPRLKPGRYRLHLDKAERDAEGLRDRAGNLVAAESLTFRVDAPPTIARPPQTPVALTPAPQTVSKPTRSSASDLPSPSDPFQPLGGLLTVAPVQLDPDRMIRDIVRLHWFRDAAAVVRLIDPAARTIRPTSAGSETHASMTPLSRVQISAIGPGVVHVYGPARSVESVRNMIHDLDRPTASMRADLLTIRLASETDEDDAAIHLRIIDQELQRYREDAEFVTRALLLSVHETLADEHAPFERCPEGIDLRATSVSGPARAILLLALTHDHLRRTALDRFAARLSSRFPSACLIDPVTADACTLPELGTLSGCGNPARHFADQWSVVASRLDHPTLLAEALCDLAAARSSLLSTKKHLEELHARIRCLTESPSDVDRRLILADDLRDHIADARDEVAREITVALRESARLARSVRDAIGTAPRQGVADWTTQLVRFNALPTRTPDDWSTREAELAALASRFRRDFPTSAAIREFDVVQERQTNVSAAWRRLGHLEDALRETGSAASEREMLVKLAEHERRRLALLAAAVRARTATADRLLAELLTALATDVRVLAQNALLDRLAVIGSEDNDFRFEAAERLGVEAVSHRVAVIDPEGGWFSMTAADGTQNRPAAGVGLKWSPFVKPDGDSWTARVELVLPDGIRDPEHQTTAHRTVRRDLSGRSLVPTPLARTTRRDLSAGTRGLFGHHPDPVFHPYRVFVTPVLLPTVADLLWPVGVEEVCEPLRPVTPAAPACPPSGPFLAPPPVQSPAPVAPPAPFPLPVPAPPTTHEPVPVPGAGLIPPDEPAPTLDDLTPLMRQEAERRGL